MKKQVIWLILAVLLAPNVVDYKKDIASPNSKIQENTNWSESIGSSRADNIQEFSGPMYKSVKDLMSFLEKRNLNVVSQNGRFILFYKVK